MVFSDLPGCLWLAEKEQCEVVCIAVFLHATKPAVFCADVRDPHGLGQTFCTALCHADFYVSVLCGEGRAGDGLRV